MPFLRILSVVVVLSLSRLAAQPKVNPSDLSPASGETVLFKLESVQGVRNQPSQKTLFTLTSPSKITKLWTYHWNNGRGKPGGTIALKAKNGTTFGPWAVGTLAGSGGVPNAYWMAKPNVSLPPGTYEVLDSNPASWSTNSEMRDMGCAWVLGFAEANEPVQPPASTSTPQSGPGTGLPEGFSAKFVVPGTGVMLSSAPGMKALLAGVTGKILDIRQVTLNQANTHFLQGPAYVRGARLVRLQPPKGYASGQSLGGTFYLSLSLDEALLQGGTSSNLGAVCSTEGWTAFIPGVLDRANHSVSVPTNHLSDWLPVRQSRGEEMAAFLKRQGLLAAKRAEDWAKDKTGDIILDGVQEFLEQNHLDQNTAGKILGSLAKNKESLQQIYEGVSSRDVDGAALSTQLLVGKILAENVEESRMAGLLNDLTKHADIAADASQAAGSFAGGDYYKASESIGRIIWKKSAIGKSIDQAIATESAAWEFLTQHQYEAAFQKYKEQGSDGLVRLFGGPSAYVREKFFKGKSVSDEVVAAKMGELFEAAKRREEAANAEQARLEKMYALFQRMEREGGASGMVADFRRRVGQHGVDGESAVFDEFLHLTRQLKRDLLSLGVDPWLPGRTLRSGNPDFSKEALDLLAAFARGGPAAYKEKLAEIARSRFPRKALKSDIQKTNDAGVNCVAPGGGAGVSFTHTPNLVVDRDDMRWNGTHFIRTMVGTARYGFKPGQQPPVGIETIQVVVEGDVDPAGTRLLTCRATQKFEQKIFKENDHATMRYLFTNNSEIELRDLPILHAPGNMSWEARLEGAAVKGHTLKCRTFGARQEHYGSGEAPEVWDSQRDDFESLHVFLYFNPKLKKVSGRN